MRTVLIIMAIKNLQYFPFLIFLKMFIIFFNKNEKHIFNWIINTSYIKLVNS